MMVNVRRTIITCTIIYLKTFKNLIYEFLFRFGFLKNQKKTLKNQSNSPTLAWFNFFFKKTLSYKFSYTCTFRYKVFKHKIGESGPYEWKTIYNIIILFSCFFEEPETTSTCTVIINCYDDNKKKKERKEKT
jgi:hypothetical protein